MTGKFSVRRTVRVGVVVGMLAAATFGITGTAQALPKNCEARQHAAQDLWDEETYWNAMGNRTSGSDQAVAYKEADRLLELAINADLADMKIGC